MRLEAVMAEVECRVTVPAEPSHGTFEVPYVGEPLTVVLERPLRDE